MPPPLNSTGAATASDHGSIDLTELQDSLSLQRAILQSLREMPDSQDNQTQIHEVKLEIQRLQRSINEARGHPHGIPARPRPFAPADTAADSKESMDKINFQPKVLGGPSSYLYNGNPTPASMSTSSTSSSSSAKRKRLYGLHLDSGDDVGSQYKSRRATPSPLQTAVTTPSTGEADNIWADNIWEAEGALDFIDLTGDDVDEVQKAEEDRYKRLKEDEEMARRYEQGVFNSVPASPIPSEPSAFDRILSRSSQAQEAIRLSPRRAADDYSNRHLPPFQSSSGPSSSTAGLTGSQRQVMPGTFFSDLSDEIHRPNDLGAQPPPNPVPARSLPASQTAPAWPTAPGFPLSFAPCAVFDRQDGYTHSQGFMAHSNGANLASSSNVLPRFPSYFDSDSSDEPYQNPWSAQQMLNATAGSSRPGSLTGGAYGPLQPLRSWGANFTGKSEPSASAFGGLGSGNHFQGIIERTNRIDWQNGLDEYGNQLPARLKHYYDDLHDDPRKTAEEIRDLLANIRPDADIPVEDRIGTPDALRYPLYPYQQLALQWMINTEEAKNKAGILADDMGLGKTVSTIALIVSRPSPDRKNKTNLIVTPVALLKQWENEIKKKIKHDKSMSVLVLHGKNATFDQIRTYDVVLTSYGKLGQEHKRYCKWVEDHPGADASIESDLAKKCPLVHPRSKFYRVILDEAQCIKNVNTLNARGACNVASTYRWCLTGTPMMNGVHELYSLIKFLKIAPYHDQKEFSKAFASLSPKSGRRGAHDATKKAMNGLRILLKAIMLRRMKNSELDGKPIITLPPKTEAIAHAVLSDDEMSFYTDLESRTQTKFNKYLRAGTVGKNYSNILVLLLRLRQACCHPHLNLDVEYAPVNGDASASDMVELAQSLSAAVIQRVKEAAEEGFNCPVCLDAVLDPAIAIPCGHDACSECFARLYDSAVAHNISAGDEGNSAKCPECRGPINAQKVISFTTFKQVHMPENLAEGDAAVDVGVENDGETASEDDDDDSVDSDTDDDDVVDANGNLSGFVVKDVGNDELVSEADNDGDGDDEFKPKKSKKSKSGKARKKTKGKGKEKEEIKPHMLKTLRHEAKKNKEDYRRYMRYLRKNWQSSAKVDECCRILQAIQATGDKTIIFSQFTFLLDLLEIPIKHELNIKFCRYDGGMSRNQRDAAAQDFQDVTSRTKVMLVSLKAGNSGLNLTAANHVIIMDPFWNPYVEMQAVDRAYRIGQQKPVQVHRIIVESTVEDRIMELQEKKRALVEAALDEGESKSLGRLSQRDLAHLFGVATRGD